MSLMTGCLTGRCYGVSSRGGYESSAASDSPAAVTAGNSASGGPHVPGRATGVDSAGVGRPSPAKLGIERK